jgi:hypothetical protein
MLPLLLAAALRVRDPDTVARADLLLVPAWSPSPAPVLGLGLPLGLLLRLGLAEELRETALERLLLAHAEALRRAEREREAVEQLLELAAPEMVAERVAWPLGLLLPEGLPLLLLLPVAAPGLLLPLLVRVLLTVPISPELLLGEAERVMPEEAVREPEEVAQLLGSPEVVMEPDELLLLLAKPL